VVHSPDALDLPREFGAYTLLKRLAVGGMAEVYVAKAQGIGGFEKLVAIKVIHPRLSEDEHFITMLVEEAKLSVLLTHGNIAQTFDLGCIDETYFIVMEYVDGADAYRILKRCEARKRQLPIDVCTYVVSEVANGLDHAHRKRDSSGKPLNVVHRDISPQNVLISHTGEVKIVDFGIAKAALRTGQTEAGVIKGKYYYMSPEQAWGDPLDHRSDIFSLGVVLYELLTGEMLYKEDNIPALLDRVRKADVLPPSLRRPEIPTTLEQIVLKACAKKPEDRYQSAHDMAQALSTFLYTVTASFTAQRLADLMRELFGEQAESGERKAPPPVAPRPPEKKAGELRSMKLIDFSHRVDSIIFDLDDEEGETRADVEPYVRGANDETRELAGSDLAKAVVPPKVQEEEEDEETLIHDKVIQAHWDASTNKAGEWSDSTTVDGGDDADPLIAPPRRIPKPPKAAPRRSIPRATPPARPSARPPPAGAMPPRPSEGALAAQPSRQAPISKRPLPIRPPVAPPPPRPATFPKEAPKGAATGAPWPPPALAAPQPQAQQPVPSWPTPAATSRPQPNPHVSQSTAEGATSPGPAPTPSIGAPDPFAAAPNYNMQTATMPRQGGSLGLRIAFAAGAALALVTLIVLVVVLATGESEPESAVEVISVPPGAAVTLDGTLLPVRTPVVIEEGLDPERTQRIEVTMAGYETWTTTFTPVEGTLKQIAVLTPLRATLTVETIPSAHVWVDGVLFGSSPVNVPNREIGSEVHIRASLMGRQDAERTVTITVEDLAPTVTLRLPEPEE